MKDKLLQIINHYGINNQQRKLQEEVFELQEAITNYEDAYEANQIYEGNDYNIPKFIEHIEEELGDVLNILEEIQLFYGISNLDGRYSKIDRQLKRMEEE